MAVLSCQSFVMAEECTKSGEDDAFLDGRLLVAMPSIAASVFERSVIYMCAHSNDGAMGLIVNKPAPELEFNDLLKQLEIETSDRTGAIQVHLGGPVEHGRGFVLHSGDYDISDCTMHVSRGFAMTATLDILRDMADGLGPRDQIMALGYAGWGPGQLEKEIQQNGWLVCDADRAIVFETADDDKWGKALATLGVSPSMLSGAGGAA